MLESRAFDEMNLTYPIEPDAEPLSPASPPAADPSASSSSGGILSKIKYKFKRQVTPFCSLKMQSVSGSFTY